MLTETAVRLGPAIVMAVRGDRLRLRRMPATGQTNEVWACPALAYPYDPVVGDVVLAIGEEEVYVIGVIAGKGRTRLEVEGDLRIHASGRICLEADTGVEIRSRDVALTADKLHLNTRVLFERAVSCYRRIKDTLQCEAGRMRTRVHGNATFQAGRILETAEDVVKIDAKQIHLG